MKIASYLKRLHSDSLYRNSIYLMVSNFIMAGIGVFFWMIVTRLYTPAQVGLATTLISITGLITSFAQLGLNNGLIRFLPKAQNKNAMISTVFTLVSMGAIGISVIFLIGLPLFSPRLLFFRDSLLFELSFVIFMVVATINGITDSVFIAYRDTKYIPIVNTIMSLVKLLIPIVLVTFGAFGIFYAFVTSVNVALVLSVIFLTLVYGYRFEFRLELDAMKRLWRFSFGTYVASFFGMLNGTIAPILITNHLGPEMTAYYFMPSMILTLLLSIPRSLSSSLFSEGSHSEQNLRRLFFKSLFASLSIMIPIVLILFIFGTWILNIFGKSYSVEGITYLRYALLSMLIAVPIYMIGTIFTIQKRVKTILVTSIFGAILGISLTYLALPYGLTGLGIASIIGYSITLLIHVLLLLKH